MATTMSSLLVALLVLAASNFRTRAALQAEIPALDEALASYTNADVFFPIQTAMLPWTLAGCLSVLHTCGRTIPANEPLLTVDYTASTGNDVEWKICF